MKKKTALYILASIICLIFVAFVFNIPIVKNLANNLFMMLKTPYILISAAVCAFIFIGTKKYWLIIAGCAIIASIIIQFVVIGGYGSIYLVAVRALAFITVVYILNLVKAIFTK